jgi:hypothetical protein
VPFAVSFESNSLLVLVLTLSENSFLVLNTVIQISISMHLVMHAVDYYESDEVRQLIHVPFTVEVLLFIVTDVVLSYHQEYIMERERERVYLTQYTAVQTCCG